MYAGVCHVTLTEVVDTTINIVRHREQYQSEVTFLINLCLSLVCWLVQAYNIQ